MKLGRPALPGASKAVRAMVAGPSLVAALCLAGALAAFLVYPAYGQSGDEATAPSNLTAAIADGGVILSWSSPVQDAASVTGYQILRRRPREGEGALLVLVADTGFTATTHVDATADEPGVRYVYRVKALRSGVKSSRSNVARVDLPEEIDEPEPGPASKDGAQADTCPDPAPTPTAVEVTAVPIVVESTTDDYFVLYVSHDVDGTEVEIPVLVKRGAAGTTTLAEHVEALPAERYRVEKYLIADPADVDGDCIDDITELDDPGNISPVNPAAAIDINDGALAVPDNQTYDALAVGGYFKFGLLGMDTDRPSAYFINAETHPTHQTFLDDRSINRQRIILGTIAYNQNLDAPDGSQGVYRYSLNTLPSRYSFSFSLMERAHTLLAASMPLLENNLAFHVRNHELPHIQPDLTLYRESRINLVFDGDVYSGINFLALNPEEGYGLLQVLDADDRPHPRNIVIYEALPNELPRVAGIITTVPQTPLSHVNLRAVQDGIPNAYIRNIRDDPAVAPLIGSYVRYEVTDRGWDLRAATKEEVDAHYEASRPQPQTPEQDLSVTEVTPLDEIDFDDWRAFGVKAANVAVLGTLDFPEGTVPEGFAIPFHFYVEFMKANGFYGAITDMLADEDFQTDFDVQDDMLDDLRNDIEDGDTPQWIISALTAMHAEFPAGQSLRYRSSTNNEDLPGFNGAGLYDSKTQDPEETEEDGIDKSLKGVFASLWTFRAFTEREFHRIDHMAAAMGVLVHPNYEDELANGVAVSFDLIYGQDSIYGRDDRYYVNTQVGEDLVTNPEARSIPEELLLRRDHDTYIVLSTSNLVEPGELLMSDAQLAQLRDYLTTIHDHFEGLYNPGSGEPFAMEIEFKIISEDVLAIKQARPWVFSDAGALNEAPTIMGDDGPSFREEATGTVASYRAMDPEGSAITWSVGGPDGDDFRISETGVLTFDSPPDYESPAGVNGNEYQVTVGAQDDGGKTASLDVTVTVTPVDEPPAITGETTIHDYDENGTGDVATYTADDPEGDTNITWTLGGTDRGDFSITGGVLRFAVAPDYERPADSGGNNHYEVIVEATDSNNNQGTRHVDLIVKNVDEPPELTGPYTIDNLPENSATSRQVGRYTASDPEGATAALILPSGEANFVLASNGVLTFKESPGYETQSSYTVTVRAKVGSGISNTVNTVDKPVTVNIQNLEEPGTVALSSVQPQAGTTLTATLDDDDGPTGTTWQWYRTSSRGSTGTAITNADSRFYTPGADDVGRYLRAVASYDDGHDTGKIATAVSANQVQVAPPDPEPPVFPLDGNYDRSIRENTRAGASLGVPVRATDANNDRLTYSIPASDYFEIDPSSGQLRTRAELDHEGREQHFVTVTATDPGGLTDTVTATIPVEDVDETPVVSGSTGPEVAENSGTSVATYTATDPDNKGIEWVLTGTDSDDLTLSGSGLSGTLTFNVVPDFEEKNQYRVVIESREQGDGTSVGRLSVTVRVSNVNEPGVLETNVEEPRAGQTVRLNVVDEDGGVNVREWKWERGEPSGTCGTVNSPMVATWETIGGATSSSYTPAAADQGHCIRATSFYDDRAGTGRTEQFLTPVSVEDGPFFTQDPPTYRVQENSAEEGDVGRVQARHASSGETLTYRLSGSDAGYFTIDNEAQLRTSATPLDYESLTNHKAEVLVTATAPDNETATITVAITVTDECTSAGEPPCAPGRPGVASASDTSLSVSWSAPKTPSGTSINGYALQYREPGNGGSWTPQSVSGTDGAHTIENLTKDTTYEVQVRARNDSGGYGEWSQSGTGTPGHAPPPPPPPVIGGGGPVGTDNECVDELGALAGAATRNGTWANDCESSVSGRGYARYYSFSLAQGREATIDLTSSVDTYLYLRQENATSGSTLHENDNHQGSASASRIQETLAAGTYTVEATTNSVGATGSFTLTITVGDLPPVNVSRAAGSEDALVRLGSLISLTATFSRPVSGFAIDDINVENGTAGNLVGSDGDAVYTFDVTPNDIGEVTVDIPAGAAEYAVGNGEPAASRFSLGITYDDDGDSGISIAELFSAIDDYFAGRIDISQLFGVIDLYFSGY